MKPRILADVARIALVSAAALAAVGSASSTSQTSPPPTPYGAYGTPQPPPPQAMEPTRATGLWKSSFGAVKVEEDQRSGAGALQGVWVYDRNGQEVIGY